MSILEEQKKHAKTQTALNDIFLKHITMNEDNIKLLIKRIKDLEAIAEDVATHEMEQAERE